MNLEWALVKGNEPVSNALRWLGYLLKYRRKSLWARGAVDCP